MKKLTDADAEMVIDAAERAVAILERADALVAKATVVADMLLDAEINHGGLIGSKTLTAANELRLELSRWK